MVVPPSISQISGLQPEEWKQAQLHERIAALQTAEFQLADSQGRPRCTISYFEGEPHELGMLDITNPVEIQINKESIVSDTPQQALQTVAHEGRHAYQLDCIKSPDRHPEADTAQVEQWRVNHEPGNYVEPKDYQRYRDQPIEADAYQYAAEVQNYVYPEQKTQNNESVESGAETQPLNTSLSEPDSDTQSWKHELGDGLVDRNDPTNSTEAKIPDQTIADQTDPSQEATTPAQPGDAQAPDPSWKHDLGEGIAEREQPPPPPSPPAETESISMSR